jgi:hypothetical protein
MSEIDPKPHSEGAAAPEGAADELTPQELESLAGGMENESCKATGDTGMAACPG